MEFESNNNARVSYVIVYLYKLVIVFIRQDNNARVIVYLYKLVIVYIRQNDIFYFCE